MATERIRQAEPIVHRFTVTSSDAGSAAGIDVPDLGKAGAHGGATLDLDALHAAVDELARRRGRYRIALDVDASFGRRCLASFGIVPSATDAAAVTFAPAPNVEIELRSGSERLAAGRAGEETDTSHADSVLEELERQADSMFRNATSREYALVDQYEWVSPGTYRLSTIRVPRRP